jgi:glyceraldehyde 3-phosphate dehydrogenase
MMPIKIAINGFGRIGRTFFRQAFSNPEIEISAINDLGDIENLVYLLKYDTVYGSYEKEIKIEKTKIIIEGKEILFLNIPEPENLPWKELKIDIVVESTGVFTSYEKAKAHLKAGAKRVVITAPPKDEITPVATPNIGIENLAKDKITSNASCTTNAVTPIVKIMGENPGILKGMLNTVHGYTASQSLIDAPSKKDFRRGRAGAQNIVPTSTGAALATEKALPEIKGKFDGIAIRVPVITGSILDFTFLAKRKTSVEEINNIFKEAAEKLEWQGILRVSQEPLVSSDILKDPYGSIVDLSLTRVVDGDLVKVLSWYDNEWGYGSMLLKHILQLKKFL